MHPNVVSDVSDSGTALQLLFIIVLATWHLATYHCVVLQCALATYHRLQLCSRLGMLLICEFAVDAPTLYMQA